jgi:hypothetical protein
MIKILITSLFLLFLKPQVYEVTNDCNNCPLQTTVNFHGTGFTPKKWIGLQVIWPNGFNQNFMVSAYPNIQVPASGEIDFQFGLTTQTGNYTVNVYETNSSSGNHWNYRTSSIFNVQ